MPRNHTPLRIVSLQPSATVILAAIGKLDRLVACTKYCADVCPEIAGRKLTIVQDSWTANTNQIAAVRPDLVIAAVPYQEKAVAEILKSGARFLGLAPKTLADIYTDIATISGVMGAADRGEEVIAEMEREIEAAQTADRRETSSSRLLRGMGQALDRIATMGGRAGARGRWHIRGNARCANISGSDPSRRPRRTSGSMVRSGGPRTAGEDSSRPRLDRDAGRPARPRLLHS